MLYLTLFQVQILNRLREALLAIPYRLRNIPYLKPSNQVIQKANSKLTSAPLGVLRARDSVRSSVRPSHREQTNQRKDENQKSVGEGFCHSITAFNLGPSPPRACMQQGGQDSLSFHVHLNFSLHWVTSPNALKQGNSNDKRCSMSSRI